MWDKINMRIRFPMTYTETKNSVFHGSFYPGTEREIRVLLDSLRDRALEPRTGSHPPIVLVPHAGWMYSGLAAMRGLSTLLGDIPERIVMIGPSHRHLFFGFSPAGFNSYKTPLGEIEIDSELRQKIIDATGFQYDPGAHQHEHSLEVNIPLIQYFFDDRIKILPILAGSVQEKDIAALAETLTRILDPKKDAILISTDLSHFFTYEEARKLDSETLDFIISGNTGKLSERSGEGGRLCCGFSGVITAIEIAKLWNLGKPELLIYYNSGDSGGDKNSVVGYASVAWRGQKTDTSGQIEN